jgi:hypothetical protein
MRLGLLLSAQETTFGFNMFDTLIPSDAADIQYLMTYGYNYVDAVLHIFERRYRVPLPAAISDSIAQQLAFVSPQKRSTIPSTTSIKPSNPVGIISSKVIVAKKQPLQALSATTQNKQYQQQQNTKQVNAALSSTKNEPTKLGNNSNKKIRNDVQDCENAAPEGKRVKKVVSRVDQGTSTADISYVRILS